MAAETGKTRGTWSSNFMFLAAAVGSAVGISNIWKFTYVAGQNGGGAFVIIYILAGLSIVLPALIAEFLIGRRGGGSVVGTMNNLAAREKISPKWRYYGFMAVIAIFMALSFYAVVAGWTIDYFILAATGRFSGADADTANAMLSEMMANPLRIMFYQGLFLALTAITVSLGIKKGLERVLSWMTPGLFIILIVLLVYAMVEGDFAAGAAFLFQPDFAKLEAETVLAAIGQAFFSVGVGVGVLMTIGSYMDKKSSILKGAIIVTLADMTAALCAGLAIFPIVFAHSMSPAEGPGLVFVALPVAFGQMFGGSVLGALFFLLMGFAALTSAITILETIVAWLEEFSPLSRRTLAILSGVAVWVFGLITVFSFNIWAGIHPLSFWEPMADKNIFGVLDYVVSNIMLPLGGILVALLAGWALSRQAVADELNIGEGAVFQCWRFATRYVVPVAISAMFIANLG